MNWLVNRLINLRLFQGNLDLHLVRASMVIIYFFFGYQKVVRLRGTRPDPVLYPRTPHLLDAFGLRDKRILLFPWRFGMAVGDRCCCQDSGTESWESWVRSDLWACSSAADDRAVSSREWTTRAAARVAHRTWRAHRSLYVAVRRGARYHLEDCALRSGHCGSLCGENGSAESMQNPVQ